MKHINYDRFSEHRDTHLDRDVEREIEREAVKGDMKCREMRERELEQAEQQMAVVDHMLKDIHRQP